MGNAWSKEFPKGEPAMYWIRVIEYPSHCVAGFITGRNTIRYTNGEQESKRSALGRYEFLGPITPTDAEEVARLRAALEAIQQMGDKTLIGDTVSLDPTVAYQHGANAAFAQVADIARAALGKAQEGK